MTISVTSELDVTSKYDLLVREALSSNSAYIRAKETIQSLVDSGAIDEAQKAEIVSNILSNVVNSITTAGMSTAMQWATAEKDLALRILEMDKKLTLLDSENALKVAQTDQVKNAIRISKVESKRLYGTAVFDEFGNVATLEDSGKVYSEILLTNANTSKVAAEEVLVNQKITESHAAVHKIVADTYVNHGSYSYTGITNSGVQGISPTHGGFTTLSDVQKEIAKEQAKGYTYSAWANALTGSASMLGTAMAAEYADFTDPAGAGYQLLQNIISTAGNLKDATVPTFVEVVL